MSIAEGSTDRMLAHECTSMDRCRKPARGRFRQPNHFPTNAPSFARPSDGRHESTRMGSAFGGLLRCFVVQPSHFRQLATRGSRCTGRTTAVFFQRVGNSVFRVSDFSVSAFSISAFPSASPVQRARDSNSRAGHDMGVDLGRLDVCMVAQDFVTQSGRSG